MITGVWKGKINKKKVELKIVLNGDSLTGTSYYYESSTNYRRYSIRGYFDQHTNNAIWWDDQLLEESTGRSILSNPGKIPYLSSADFNCPGSDKMYLEGKAAPVDDPQNFKGPVDLEKTDVPIFPDEWDFVIENFTVGGNDPYIIDSISSIALNKIPEETTPELKPVTTPAANPVTVKPQPVVKNEPVISQSPVQTIQDKFIKREKVFTKEIPLTGDSLELRFYDNAEIDGDSISLFLNDKLIFEHIKLTGNPYTIKLPVSELNNTNELIMVAENLGAIPPNTSYMIAIVEGKRYDAYLASSENASAMIRLVKKN